VIEQDTRDPGDDARAVTADCRKPNLVHA
jgi:hypothetical protein